jgi:hypothetical protein
MEAILTSLLQSKASPPQKPLGNVKNYQDPAYRDEGPNRSGGNGDVEAIRAALANLSRALEAALPLFSSAPLDDTPTSDDALPSMEVESPNESERTRLSTDGDGVIVSAEWLLELCHRPDLQAATALDPLYLAKSIVDAAKLPDESAQQSALFDILGAAEEAWNLLVEITPRLPDIRRRVTPEELDRAASGAVSAALAGGQDLIVDLEEERRQMLLLEAWDAAQVAAVAQAEVDAILNRNRGVDPAAAGGGTHTIQRASDKRAIKDAEKAVERANKALQRAKDAGAILDESDLLAVDRNSLQLGGGGLMNRTPEQVAALQQALLPEGAKQYYGDKGLPLGTIHETDADGSQRVIIPPAIRDESTLPNRLLIRDIMDPEIAKAFEGTKSLNPMQSAVFETAFHTRDNVLVCGTSHCAASHASGP